MVSQEAEQVREQSKNVVGPTYRAMFEVPIDSRRTQFEALMSRIALPPDVVIEEIEAGGGSCEQVRIAGAVQEPSPETMLYLHGGGFMLSSACAERILAAAIARITGRAVLSVNYRLAPEHPFPADLEDTLTVYRWWLSGG